LGHAVGVAGRTAAWPAGGSERDGNCEPACAGNGHGDAEPGANRWRDAHARGDCYGSTG
jgi:hypothetical protein